MRWKLTADQVDALRPHVHQEVLDGLATAGGVAPNAYIETDQQAADYAAQTDEMVVSVALVHALRIGLSHMMPHFTIDGLDFRPLPDDYQPPIT